MKHSESLANIGAALSKVQGSVKVALKESDNPHLKSKYADLGSVWDACRAALAENNLSVVQLPVSDEPGYIALETMLLHASGEFIASTCRVKLQKDDPQGAGSGLTYLRRYSLSSALGIVSDIDDDGHAASTPEAAQKLQQSAARPSAPTKVADPAPVPIGDERGKKLHESLSGLLEGTSKAEVSLVAYAVLVLGTPITHLAKLTEAQGRRVLNAARTLAAAESKPAA